MKQKVSTKISPVNLARPSASSKDRQRDAREVQNHTRDTVETLQEPRGSGAAGPCCLKPAEHKARVLGGDRPGSLLQANRFSEQPGVGLCGPGHSRPSCLSRRLPLHPLPPLPAHFHLQALLCPTGRWSSCPAPNSAHTSLPGAPTPGPSPLSP